MPQRGAQLVCQHLENISRDVLAHYSAIIREFVRGRHGVYALYRGNRLYYVGLATNLRACLHQHLRDRHAETWDHFSLYLTVGDQHLREIECLLVRIGRPRGNRAKPKFLRSQNLRPGLRRQISEWQRRELRELFPGSTTQRAKPQTAEKGALPTYPVMPSTLASLAVAYVPVSDGSLFASLSSREEPPDDHRYAYSRL
jgi:hypothetical protein